MKRISPFINNGAENETRTRDPNLGKVVLYQLSYFRNMVPQHRIELWTQGFSVPCSTNFELVTSAVTGRHSNQLNHRAVFSSSIISIGYFFAAVKLFYKNAAQFHGATSGYPNCLASSRR